MRLLTKRQRLQMGMERGWRDWTHSFVVQLKICFRLDSNDNALTRKQVLKFSTDLFRALDCLLLSFLCKAENVLLVATDGFAGA